MARSSGFIPRASGGEPVTGIRPATWNNIADTLNGGATGTSGTASSPPNRQILIRNDSDEDRDTFDSVSLGDPLWTVELGAKEQLIYSMANENRWRPVAVLQEPIAQNLFGKAVIAGTTLAKVRGLIPGSSDYTYGPANYTPGFLDASNNWIIPGNSGNCRILAPYPTSASTRLCYVQLNVSDPGAFTAHFQTRDASGVQALEPNTGLGGIDPVAHQPAVNYHPNHYMGIETVVTDTLASGFHYGYKFHRPGYYRIYSQVYIPNNTGTNRNYSGRLIFADAGTLTSLTEHKTFQGVHWRDSNYPNMHTFVDYIEITEGQTIKPRIGGSLYNLSTSGAGTIQSAASAQALGRLMIELVEPRTSSVDYADPEDDNPWIEAPPP